MYAILVNADDGQHLGIECLAMVDRTKSEKLWWISDNENLIMCFKSYKNAKKQLDRLKHKNPRIVNFSFAKQKIIEQKESIRNYKNNCVA